MPSLPKKMSVKIGMSNTKYGTYQRYKCKNCGKTFSDRPFQHATYPPEIIFTAISQYNLGNTKKKVAAILHKKFKMDVPIPTIHSWLKRYEKVCTFTTQRKRFKLDPNTTIQSKKLHHVQVYDFKYHQLKLNFAAKKFPSLRNFINEMYLHCPNKFFRSKGPRCSTLRVPFKPRKATKQNNAIKLAGYALQMARSNRDRHQKIQDFMLINDSATVAIELPVFLSSNELTNKEKRSYGLDFSGTLTGHIDVLQVRFNKIHVLDFKPEAINNDLRFAEQVFLYTIALSKRTNLPLSNFICAYFDHKNYFQFSPLY
jgi:transposase-like protein